jgi:hypothetical protein
MEDMRDTSDLRSPGVKPVMERRIVKLSRQILFHGISEDTLRGHAGRETGGAVVLSEAATYPFAPCHQEPVSLRP